VTGVERFINESRHEKLNMKERRMQQFRNMWVEVDSNMDKKLDFLEVKDLICKLNIDLTDTYLKELINKYDENQNGALDFDEFYEMMEATRRREEVTPYF